MLRMNSMYDAAGMLSQRRREVRANATSSPMTQARASPIRANFRPRASPLRNSSRCRQSESQLRPNTLPSRAPALEQRDALRVQATGESQSPVAIENLLVLDREAGRWWWKLDAEVLEERILVIGVIHADEKLVQGRVDPVQPTLIVRLYRKRIGLGPPGVDADFVFL